LTSISTGDLDEDGNVDVDPIVDLVRRPSRVVRGILVEDSPERGPRSRSTRGYVAVNLKVGVDIKGLVEVYDLAATAQGPLFYTS
jgi:hypothetical protein